MRVVLLDDSTAESIGILLRELISREKSAFGGDALPETVQVAAAWETALNEGTDIVHADDQRLAAVGLARHVVTYYQIRRPPHPDDDGDGTWGIAHSWPASDGRGIEDHLARAERSAAWSDVAKLTTTTRITLGSIEADWTDEVLVALPGPGRLHSGRCRCDGRGIISGQDEVIPCPVTEPRGLSAVPVQGATDG